MPAFLPTLARVSDAEHELVKENRLLRDERDQLGELAARALRSLREAQEAAGGEPEEWVARALHDLEEADPAGRVRG